MVLHLPSAEEEEALIPLSALQHHLFCPRQCALIHVERLWAEDGATAEGRLMHERVDSRQTESRPGLRVLRGLAIRSLALGVAGLADAVEMRGRPALPFPVEYKRGRPKAHRADEVQLCAQAICLEEMFGTPVPEGALYYGETRRRVTVTCNAELRALTAQVAAEARAMLASGRTPPPCYGPGCRRCSMVDLCQPKVAPCAGAWIETSQARPSSSGAERSLPVRGRGLKHRGAALGLREVLSLPVRGRGLKHGRHRRLPRAARRSLCGGVD